MVHAHRLAESESRLDALYAKQGRLTQFLTNVERDLFLRKEIGSIQSYLTVLMRDLEGMHDGLEKEKDRLVVVEERDRAVREEMNERKEKMRVSSEDLASWKEEHAEKVERRK